jgi:hypothetical protein
MCQVRESFSGLRMDMPVEEVFARSRVRRRRRLSGLTAVTAATAGAAAAIALTVGGHGALAPATAGASHQPQPSPSAVTLAAFSVNNGPGDRTRQDGAHRGRRTPLVRQHFRSAHGAHYPLREPDPVMTRKPAAAGSAAPVAAMTAAQRDAFDRDGYLIIPGALGPDEVAAARDPNGAIEVSAAPGDALFFDRRIWHTRSRNYSEHTRKAIFFGYAYRWTAIRDDTALLRSGGWFDRLTPVQQQLPGGARDTGGDHVWGHDPATTPLYGWLKDRGLLDPANPPLRP